MHLPNQSKPAVRDARRRPWRSVNAGRPGLLPQQEDEAFEVDEGDESAEATDGDESSG
ncbi:MAG: hypothetical protein JNN08_09850 [Bryobacterales bacterium]|nr:hypothetical protein [Bryobacterales bacterium]